MPGGSLSVDPSEFAGKRVPVTGGARGMGEAMAKRLAAVAFLVSDPVAALHGSEYVIDGGTVQAV